MRQHVRYRGTRDPGPRPLASLPPPAFPHRSFRTGLSAPTFPHRPFRTGRRPPAEPLEENVISRRYLGSTSRLSSWMLAVALAVPAASPPAWTLRLAIHYLPPATNHSQYDVVLAWPGQASVLRGTHIGCHPEAKVQQIKHEI